MSAFVSGDYNAICDVCGFEFKASKLRKRWDGLMVCQKDWETRHPQDLMRARPERSKVPWSRPSVPDSFVAGGFLRDENDMNILDSEGNAITTTDFTSGAEGL